ncbi:hypothetical protein [Candidatus Protochlamydia phocaeensis]|uniref:hypothetical protein n=1 Tax=Candidatus Protochlamydia phocaeensis TaxID=1414722 RepID=UPI00083922BF|nr:hypothetical protein [Candidatus Protochlamydia phocaeensis]
MTSFSGPSLWELPFRPIVGFVGGCLYGVLFKVPIGLAASAFSIRELADPIFFNIANAFVGDGGKKSARIYAITNLTVNVATLVLLYRWNLIGQIGLIAFSALMGLEMLCKWADFSKYNATLITS